MRDFLLMFSSPGQNENFSNPFVSEKMTKKLVVPRHYKNPRFSSHHLTTI